MSGYATASRQRMRMVAVLLAPLAGVLCVKGFDAIGPRASTAAMPPSPAPAIAAPMLAPRAPVTPRQAAAMKWIAEQGGAVAGLESPLVQPSVAKESPEPVPEDEAPRASAQPELKIPTLRLTGFVVGASGRFASINHTFYREGQEVVPGWTLRTVNSARRQVVIEHEGGTKIELFDDSDESR